MIYSVSSTMTTPFHAKYFAHELTRQVAPGGADCLSMALFDACVDLNPHQIEGAMFALRSPLSKGVILADEVGLGKTIEAGLVLCQYWAERKRKLLIICPANLRKQWSLELFEKFNLPNVILDSKSYRQCVREGEVNPFDTARVVITSFHFASRYRDDIRAVPFDLVVIDEAHKLRNAYRPNNKMGQNIKWAVEDRKKCLLTATPLQNSLVELFGLATILDDKIFGDINSFRTRYTGTGGELADLRKRLSTFCHRTLRRQVIQYIQYTERRPITISFEPTDQEQRLYEAVSEFLVRPTTFSVPSRQRHLITLLLRKLLASSSLAIAGTLESMRDRLVLMKESPSLTEHESDFLEQLIELDDLEDDYLDEILEETDDADEGTAPSLDIQELDAEIVELTRYSQWARSIGIDSKSRSLVTALERGFGEMEKLGAKRKALIFTESRRTQEYLASFLEARGFAGRVVLFNGTNADPSSRGIIDRWIEDNAANGRVTGSRAVDSRTALIEHFRDHAEIMIATEAAAEGVNMQFCSLVINYDLPWNPQRIEQRIGRCHRYGQKHDVVVVNFLNNRNQADARVQELLATKFNLFHGIFGASDEVLGQIESGVDFEKRILQIHQQCRTNEEIDEAFQKLRQDMEESIQTKMDETRQALLEYFDEDVHSRLKMRLDDARANLGRVERMFWSLSKAVLNSRATFDEERFAFELQESPLPETQRGEYRLISKDHANVPGEFLYRLSHPLGEWAIEQGKQADTPASRVTFDVSNHPTRITAIEELRGNSGWLTLQNLVIDSFDRESHLLFSTLDKDGKSLDQETSEKLFRLAGFVGETSPPPPEVTERLRQEAGQHAKAAIARATEMNNQLFNEERERLEKWAEDMIVAAEKDLSDTKAQMNAVRRQSRLATTLDEQNELQRKLRDLEKKQRKQRQQIFVVEDEIADKRDTLIERLQQRMTQNSHSTHLFTIQWEVV